MQNINLKQKSLIPHLKCYKKIADECEVYKNNDYFGLEPFDVYKIESFWQNEKFLGGYLATSNTKTKNIDIYKIYSKDNIEKISSIEIGYNNIHSVKYFYDSFHDIPYLTALINEKTNILIWRIEKENKYTLITNYKEEKSQGGYSMSVRPIRFCFYMLLFDEEKSYLILIYNVQSGCSRKLNYIEKYDFINNKKLDKLSHCNVFFSSEYKGFPINLNQKNYFGLLNEGKFILYNIFSSDLKKSLEKETKKIKLICSKYGSGIRNGVIIRENNEDKYLYYNEYYKDDYYNKFENDQNHDKNFIHKIDLINKEYLFKTAINIDELFSITVWNKNYLLLFEKISKNIHLFNTKTFRIVNKFINVDGDVYIGKKLAINNEELLFVSDLGGIINIWINE